MDDTAPAGRNRAARKSRRSTSGKPIRAIVGVATAAVLGVFAAPAAADWSKSFAISGSATTVTFGTGPVVAAQPGGSFVTAWVHSLPGQTSTSIIEARRVGADGNPGSLLTLTPDAANLRGASVFANPDGSALVFWHRLLGQQGIALEARRIRPDGTLGAVLTLSEPGDRALRIGVATDPAGTTTIGWVDQINDSSVLKVRQISPNDDLGAVHTLTRTLEGRALEVAPIVAPDGKVVVIYNQFGRIKMQRLSPSGEPLPGVTQLSPETDTAAWLNAQADSAGTIRVSWGLLDPEPLNVFSRTVAPDGTLGPIQTVASQRSASPVLALDAAGSGAIAWQDTPLGSANPESVWASTIAAGGSPGQPFRVSALSATGGMDPELGADAQGTLLAVWQRDTGGQLVAEAARFSGAGLLGGVSTLSLPSDLEPSPDIAVSPDGRALAVWWQSGPKGKSLVARASLFVPPATDPPPSSAPTPRCHGRRASIIGTRHDDEMVGTTGRDVIVGRRGADVIRGRGGKDVICGWAGRDRLRGNRGHDRVFGGRGRDDVRP